MTRIADPLQRVAPWRHLPAFSAAQTGRSMPSSRLADGALFAFAVALGGITQGYLWHSHGQVLDWVDLAAGAVACLALWWRRAHPMAVFVLAFGAAAFSPLALGAGLVAVCTAASRVRGRALVAVVVMAAAASVVFPVVNPSAGEILQIGFPAFLVTVIAFGWGLYLRARRELIASLRERAERLEADQQRSAEQAREAERRRIAREMHDVLAHRLSLLSVHAGALEFNSNASAAEDSPARGRRDQGKERATRHWRTFARWCCTVLRSPAEDSTGDGTRPPQTGLVRKVPDLVEESQSARHAGRPRHPLGADRAVRRVSPATPAPGGTGSSRKASRTPESTPPTVLRSRITVDGGPQARGSAWNWPTHGPRMSQARRVTAFHRRRHRD